MLHTRHTIKTACHGFIKTARCSKEQSVSIRPIRVIRVLIPLPYSAEKRYTHHSS